jgi:hypothetical protein
MNKPMPAAGDAAGLVNDMRMLVQTAEPTIEVGDRDQLEHFVSARVATVLMVLMVMIIFVTSALPDVGPSLAKVVEAHL